MSTEKRIDTTRPKESKAAPAPEMRLRGNARARVDSSVPVEPRRATPVPSTDAPLHVVPGDDGWMLRFEGHDTAVAVLPTKKDAMKRARTLAQLNGARLVEHGVDGRIR